MNEFKQTNQTFEEVGTENTGLQTYTGKSDDGRDYIMELSSRQISYSSWQPKTEAEQDALFVATADPDKRIKECVNMEIELQHIFIEVVQINNGDGTRTPAPRTVLIDTKGISYQGCSMGIFSSVKRLIDTYGTLNPKTGLKEWTRTKKIKIMQKTNGLNTTMTFVPVVAKPVIKKK